MPSKIEVIICDDATEVAIRTANIFSDLIKEKPNCVLGLATGSTPEQTYAELVRLYNEKGLSFAEVKTFNLDEYFGLPADHPQSYHYFMDQHLFSHIDINPENIRILDGCTDNPKLECEAFEEDLGLSNGVDIWLLGLGRNGHIAFNEPGSAVNSFTRPVDLSKSTIEANSRFFDDSSKVPRQALTVGIGTICDNSHMTVLLATGSAKAEAVAAAIEGPYTSRCPASLLQKHPDCVFIIDKEAAAKLKGEY